jgi:hypothetical protein
MPQCYWLVELHCYAKPDLYYRQGSPFDWTTSDRHATRYYGLKEAEEQVVKFAKYQTTTHRILAVQYPKPVLTLNPMWSI